MVVNAVAQRFDEGTPDLWRKLQFVPGDICTIYLGDIATIGRAGASSTG
jgi:hypothetical protein